MATLVALLRAVNVGGTGKLPMADLVAMCGDAGFRAVRTFIASGNVVFETRMAAARAKAALEARLEARSGKPVGVVVRTPAEMAAVLAGNPFPDAAPNRVIVVFLDDPLPADWESGLRHRGGERLVAAGRELYVHYGDGMASSRLLIPAARAGTGRNLNTVAALVRMAGGPPGPSPAHR